MNNACMKWNDHLLEAALAEVTDSGLRDHLSQCAGCAARLQALRARREQMDTLLPLLARPAGIPPDLYTRTMGAAEASRTHRQPNFWRQGAFAGAVAVIVIAATIGWTWKQRRNEANAELRAAQQLAQWRSPTQVLLQIPGQEFLTNTPKLDESYINVPMRTERGGNE
jgi:hypothetical protein